MAEQLGEALLVLRTDDAGLDAGMRKAKAGAEGVGAAFDRTKASADRLPASLGRTGQAAAGAGVQFTKAGQQVVVSAGAQRAGMQQLGMQLGDMATMYSLGARPAQIFASQIGQVTQAIQLASGGTSKFAAFLSGPWGIAATVATIMLAPLVSKLFETEDAMEKVEFASSAMADIQAILANSIDLTTGKIKEQTDATLALSRAQLAQGLSESVRAKNQARLDMVGIRKGTVELQGGMGGGIGFRRVGNASADIVSAYQDGSLNIIEAERGLRSLMDTGIITDEAYNKASAAMTTFAVASENVKRYDAAQRGLAGDTAAIQQFLRPGRPERTRKGPKPPKDRSAEIAGRQADEIARLEQEELRAKLDLATDAGERAALQEDLLNAERADRVRQIEADKDLDVAQKAAQLAYIDRLYGKAARGADGGIVIDGDASLLGQRIARETREREVQLANDALARQADALFAQSDITDSLEKRDDLERRALELQQQIESNLLEQEIANGRVADADAARALLAEKQVADRARQLRTQRGPLEIYRDQIRATAENIDREIEEIEVRGLEHLNDGLVDAIMGAKSLGEVFHDVSRGIIADLLRIAIQQELIRPLANLLWPGAGFGGGGGGGLFGFLGKALGFAGAVTGAGGPTNLLGGTPYGGGRAIGGPIDAGTAYLVGEDGPEMIIPRDDAHVVPNHALAGRAPAVVELRVRKGEMFEVEVERISGEVTVRGISEAAPILVEGAIAETARRMSRPRI
jgi:hypothetical protein